MATTISISVSLCEVGEHSAYGAITLLGGLEVRGVDGQWINADPLPETVLVNVGHLNVDYQGINVVVVDLFLYLSFIFGGSRLYS